MDEEGLFRSGGLHERRDEHCKVMTECKPGVLAPEANYGTAFHTAQLDRHRYLP